MKKVKDDVDKDLENEENNDESRGLEYSMVEER